MKKSDRQLLITYVLTFGFIKLFTSVMVLYYFWSREAVIIILLLSVPWVLGGVWYVAHLGRRGVLRWKVRKLRRRLLWEEWNVDDYPGDPVTHHSTDGDQHDSH